jgi:hypothetical protein
MSGRNGIDRMINNTALLVPAGSGPDVLRQFRYITDADGQLKQLIPLEGDEHPDRDRIWCQHGVAIDDRRVCLSFIKVRMLDRPTPPLPLPFEIVGSGLAVGSTDDWHFKRVERDGDSLLWRADEPHFAAAFYQNPIDGYCYMYGSVQRGGVHQCCLARATISDIARPDRFEYLASESPRWSQSVSDATPLFDRMPSELSVSFNEYLGRYLAVHSLELSGRVVGRTSPSPWGPWSDPVDLWTASVQHAHPIPYPTLVYAGKEHPEIADDGGRKIYLTYIEFEEYFPHLVEVTLA